MASPSLLGLPLELRRRIYGYYLENGAVLVDIPVNDTTPRFAFFEQTSPEKRAAANLKLSCRQLHDELDEFFIAHTCYTISYSKAGTLKKASRPWKHSIPDELKAWQIIPEAHAASITHIHLQDRHFWSALLPVSELQESFPALKKLTLEGRPLYMKFPSQVPLDDPLAPLYMSKKNYTPETRERIELYLCDVIDSARFFFGERQQRRVSVEVLCRVQRLAYQCKFLTGQDWVRGYVMHARASDRSSLTPWKPMAHFTSEFEKLDAHRPTCEECSLTYTSRLDNEIVR